MNIVYTYSYLILVVDRRTKYMTYKVYLSQKDYVFTVNPKFLKYLQSCIYNVIVIIVLY